MPWPAPTASALMRQRTLGQWRWNNDGHSFLLLAGLRGLLLHCTQSNATATHVTPPPPPALRPLSLLPVSLHISKLPVCGNHKNYSPYLSIHDIHSSHCWMERPVWVKRSTRLPGQILSPPGQHHVGVLGSIWKIRQHSQQRTPIQMLPLPDLVQRLEQHHCHRSPQSEHHRLAKCSLCARLLGIIEKSYHLYPMNVQP